jgi:hypothetical protein
MFVLLLLLLLLYFNLVTAQYQALGLNRPLTFLSFTGTANPLRILTKNADLAR